MRGMRALTSAAMAVAGVGLVAQSAQAAISGDAGATIPGVQLVRVPIDTTAFPNAKTADGAALDDTKAPRVFDLRVTQADGEQWTVGTLKAALTGGTFYSHGTA